MKRIHQTGDPLWFQVFQELMCRLYKAFGGDCSELDWGEENPVSAVCDQIRSAWLANGPPTNPQAVAELESILSDIEAHLPECELTPAELADVEDLIGDIRGSISE